MKKQLLFLLLAFMPVSMIAQMVTTEVVTVNDLEYLQDYIDGVADSKGLYIYVGSGSITTTDGKVFNGSSFLPDGTLRGEYRKKIGGDSSTDPINNQFGGKWYKSGVAGMTCLDDVTDITSLTASGIADYTGIAYFPNLEKLKLNSNNSSATDLIVDLSKNTKLTTLNLFNGGNSDDKGANFGTGNNATLNISNTKITSLGLTGANTAGRLEYLIAENSSLTSLSITACKNLQSLSLANSANLTMLYPYTNTGVLNSTLKNINVVGTGLTALNLTAYSALTEVFFDNTKLDYTVGNTGKIKVNETSPNDWVQYDSGTTGRLVNVAKITEWTVDVTKGESTDLSRFKSLQKLTLIGATDKTSVTLPQIQATSNFFILDITESPTFNPDLATGQSTNSLQKIKLVGVTSDTQVTYCNSSSVTLDVSESPGYVPELSDLTNCTSLTLIGATDAIMPKRETIKYITVNAYESPDLLVDFSGSANLNSLTCNGVSHLDISNCPDLTEPRYLNLNGSKQTLISLNACGTKLETLSLHGCEKFTTLILNDTTTALKKLDLCYTAIDSLDFYDDENDKVIAPNLENFIMWYTPLEYLDLSYHTKLGASRYPCAARVGQMGDPHAQGYQQAQGLSLVPTPKSAETWGIIAGNQVCTNIIKDIDAYNASNKLRVVKLRHCTNLGYFNTNRTLYLTHGFAEDTKDASEKDDEWMYYSNIEEVDLTGCTGLQRFACMNTKLKKLTLDGCENLEWVSIDQGNLTGLNGDISTRGCKKLKTLIAKRQKWESLDFFLSPDIRTAEELAAIQQIQVNGGSYTLKTPDGTRYVRKDENGKEILYTSRLRKLDLSHLTCWDGDGSHAGLQKLLVDCNLLTELDLSVVGPGLQELQCTNNMLTTLNLAPLTESVKKGILRLSLCNWAYQIGFAPAETVKGRWDATAGNWMPYGEGEDEETHSGSHDWVALHMQDKGGFTHHMDNNFGLFWNLYDARNGLDTIAKKAEPWMCKVQEIPIITSNPSFDGYDSFYGDYPCPVGHAGQHIFLHSQADIIHDFGGVKDQDLTGTLLTYKFNNGFLQKRVANKISGAFDPSPESEDFSLDDLDDFNYSEPSAYYKEADKNYFRKKEGNDYVEYTKEELLQDKGHITIRMHLYPYLLNINPQSKNKFSREQQEVNYFSSTIILDYDALIPQGVTVYTISGIKERSVFEARGKKLDGQLTLEKFGGEGCENKILPANTPVYVRAASPQPAGLYAFQPIRDVVLLGWENLRGSNQQDDYILHGMERLNQGEVLDSYVNGVDGIKFPEALEQAIALLNSEPHKNNVLRGWIGKKYEDVLDEEGKPLADINDRNFNKFYPGDGYSYKSVKALSVLTLGIQNQLSTWPVIGFWPFRGTRLSTNRCYIPYNEIYGTANNSSAKGFNFFFVGEETDENGVTEINEVVKDEKVQEGWYNMQGVRLNGEPTKRGVYIHNGKKVTIK
ncbi:MAG: hypothetical protein IJ698_08555 [Prevotella sp.]|nr:hypothetical protein [Prevotella sp.]